MGEFKGTKWPWVMEKNNAYIEIKGEGEIHSVADTCMSGAAYDNGDCLNGEITLANSRLIAAAPEILEALQSIIYEGGTLAYSSSHPISIAAIEAIKKALGETK